MKATIVSPHRLCLYHTMPNRSLTPPGRLYTQLINAEDSSADAYTQLDSDPATAPCKRSLDDEPYRPTSSAQRHAKGKTPKKRKMASSLPSYVKRNVVREVATVRMSSAEDPAQCVVSGASEQRMIIEFSHVVSGSTPLDEVSVTCFCG